MSNLVEKLRPYKYLLAKIAMVFVVLSTIMPTWWQNRSARAEIDSLKKQVRTLRKQVTFYQDEIDAIHGDPTYVEYLLRDQLHYGYEAEYILRENGNGRDR